MLSHCVIGFFILQLVHSAVEEEESQSKFTTIYRNYSNSVPNSVKVGDYDLLIFTQAWPPTSCYEWEDKSPSHQCNLPPNEEWSIHGLWPEKIHTMGPFFCNSSLHFDLKALEPIRAQLEVKWIDVHKGAKPHEFWRHEWEKHGTCSVDIDSISNEVKYFKKGLDLLDQYDMKHVLGKANIVPYQKYKLQDYLDGVRKILGVDAYVECVKNSKRNEVYISELRICFDKQFKLIGCEGIPHFPSNCDKTAPIIYPGSVPDLTVQPVAVRV